MNAEYLPVAVIKYSKSEKKYFQAIALEIQKAFDAPPSPINSEHLTLDQYVDSTFAKWRTYEEHYRSLLFSTVSNRRIIKANNGNVYIVDCIVGSKPVMITPELFKVWKKDIGIA